MAMLATEPDRPEQHSVGAFLTDRAIDWIGERAEPWFAHLSYLRPHPPYAAPGEWADEYDPDQAGEAIEQVEQLHPYHATVLQIHEAAAPTDPDDLAHLRAQYFGMIGHVDHQVGRLCDVLRDRGQWDDTLIIVTADHGEMLGDHGLKEKLGYWEQSYAIPCIIRDPSRSETHGSVVEHFTENVDVMPTICEAIGAPVPTQCDGLPLTPFLDGEVPDRWRLAAHWEYDWRALLVDFVPHEWPWDRTLERQHLAVHRTESHAYVHFGNGTWLCFDLAADPTWRTTVDDPAVVLPLAQDMLSWRSHHTDRTLTDLVISEQGGAGRWPELPWRD
jgi:arylsulfatase A-like enzyme